MRHTKLTKAQALASFREMWNAACQADPRLHNDRPAKAEAWNNYTDGLCKDGQITQHQYDTWVTP